MKVAVLSDAHGARGRMDALLHALPGIDALCFLGDMDRDAEYLDWGLQALQPGTAFHAVAGNNDPFSHRARTIELRLGDVRTLMTHGHLFPGIRTSPRALAKRAHALDCRLALYGHTHRQCDAEMEGVRIVNPGALLQGEWALLTLNEGGIQVSLRTL